MINLLVFFWGIMDKVSLKWWLRKGWISYDNMYCKWNLK